MKWPKRSSPATPQKAVDFISEDIRQSHVEALPETLFRHTFTHEAQAEHHELTHRQAPVDWLAVAFGRLASGQPLDVLRDGLHVPPTPLAIEAVRAGAKSQVPLVAPVD
jgi:hypothetical protein